MINFIPGSQRKRTRLFDEQIAVTIETLSRPEVKKALPFFANLIARECGVAFLPNLRHGVARLPCEEEGTGNVALLPLLKSDGRAKNIRLSHALTAPSATTVALVNVACGKNLIDVYDRKFTGNQKVNRDVDNAITCTPRIGVGFGKNKRVVAGRSVIVMANYQRQPSEIAETVAHEMQHVFDAHRVGISPAVFTNKLASRHEDACQEYRAYRVSHLLLNALGEYDDLKTEMMNAWNEFDLDASAGFVVSDGAIERAEALGVI
ncbi:MAG: hypothetical protein WAQ24_01795 [Candidatus Saccharimonadales bacterium]